MESDKEMGFLDHLEELRWRIIKSLIGIIIGGVGVGIFIDWIMNNIIFAPAANSQPPLSIINLRPYGQFVIYMEVILIGGAVISVPNIIYQIWKFVEPALKEGEKKYVSGVVIFTSVCFITGVVFSYFLLLPAALGFFANFGSTIIENKISADEYMSFVLSLIIASGLVFELPMLSFFLSKIGILKPSFMRKYRRHAIVVILLVAGIVTPGPDITSQVLLGIPLLGLYELSILICKYSQKKTS
ncbi:MAG: twin-arginine translocase subunit TatC [Ignavibacteria bacterium]|nr:twin-arginine translocase subunit TatC [Ignavibacteria bacterium]